MNKVLIFKDKFLKRAFAGVLTGAVNGLFGGGGGMIAVPLLRGMLGYEEKQAHATAIFVIAPVCAASAVVYVVNGYAATDIIIPSAIGTVLGGLVGAYFLSKCPKTLLNIFFIALMFVAGFRMLTA